MSVSVPDVTLANGVRIPQLGLGTWPMSDREAERTVPLALDLGYRLIDTAYAYGNEHGVGRGIRAAGVPREELFVTTKLNGEWHGVRGGAGGAGGQRRPTGPRLRRPVPDPLAAARGTTATSRRGAACSSCSATAAPASIGVSNFKPEHIERLIASRRRRRTSTRSSSTRPSRATEPASTTRGTASSPSRGARSGTAASCSTSRTSSPSPSGSAARRRRSSSAGTSSSGSSRFPSRRTAGRLRENLDRVRLRPRRRRTWRRSPRSTAARTPPTTPT